MVDKEMVYALGIMRRTGAKMEGAPWHSRVIRVDFDVTRDFSKIAIVSSHH